MKPTSSSLELGSLQVCWGGRRAEGRGWRQEGPECQGGQARSLRGWDEKPTFVYVIGAIDVLGCVRTGTLTLRVCVCVCVLARV